MIVRPSRWRRAWLAAACCAALAASTLAATGAPAAASDAPVVTTNSGAVRGVDIPEGYAFRGIPYAAPPTGNLRWRPPAPPATWQGVRDASDFGPSCPQPQGPVQPPPPFSEDCLYLNVSTPAQPSGDSAKLPVLVWIHGGGFASDNSRNYDPAKLVANGAVVVTINYRLGALGFLAHPALASVPGGPSGNYGLMDQQAALNWVQDNIAQFGGNPRNVTIAGESAGGVSVLDHMVAPGSRGLFQRAIAESGSFGLTQQSLASAETAGQDIAAKAGCPDQTAQCLRQLPVDSLVNNFPPQALPGVVDGKVLTEPIRTALAAGRFADVPFLNGTNHEEEEVFLAFGLANAQGTHIPVPDLPISAENYESNIISVLGVSTSRAQAIEAEYPLTAYASPEAAFRALTGDVAFACSALQIDRWTAAKVPTFAYEFNDDNAPQTLTPPGSVAPVATHFSELQYLFGMPNAPFPMPLSADQETLAASMRTAWTNFAASSSPASTSVPWPAFEASGAKMLSLLPPQPQVEADFAAKHHCSFWAAG